MTAQLSSENEDEDFEQVVQFRKNIRKDALKSRDPAIRSLIRDLLELESYASPFFLGLDYDADDLDDYLDRPY